MSSHEHGFATVEPNDHRAWLWVASLVIPVYSLLVLAARISSKWELLYYDDAMLGIAYAFAFIHWGLLYEALYCGLGTSIELMDSPEWTASTYFNLRIFLLLSLGCTKASALLFTRRIFLSDLFQKDLAFNASLALVGIWTIVSLVLSSAGCHPSRALSPTTDGFCTANIAKWKAIVALDAFTEILIIALPTFFVMKNTIKRSKKLIVVFVYSFRLIVVAFSIVALLAYIHYLKHGVESIGLAPTIAWQEILLGTSLMTASIPCLRSFLWAFYSRASGGRQWGIATSVSMGGFGGAGVLSTGIRSLGISRSSLNKDGQRSQRASTAGFDKLESGFDGHNLPESTGYNASVSAGRVPNQKSDSAEERPDGQWTNESQENIIGISRTVDVEIERG